METTLSGLLGTGRGSEVPTTAASLGFLSGTSKGERPDGSWGEAGAANENTQEIVVLAGLAAGTLRQVKGQRGGGGGRTCRHLRPTGAFLFAVIRVRRRGVGGRPALPLHAGGNAAALQVPENQHTTRMSAAVPLNTPPPTPPPEALASHHLTTLCRQLICW